MLPHDPGGRITSARRVDEKFCSRNELLVNTLVLRLRVILTLHVCRLIPGVYGPVLRRGSPDRISRHVHTRN